MTNAVVRGCAALCTCVAVLLLSTAGATGAVNRVNLSFDQATQSHPGACSQDTLNVAHAVSDLSANGVLGQYAALIGVHATSAALSADVRGDLTVVEVAATTVTANHGCTTDGVIFGAGNRTLNAGETVGVALPKSVREVLCAGKGAGCVRRVITLHTVFPTNCWNLDQGDVKVVVYERQKPKVKATVRVDKPSAQVSTACGVGNAGTTTVTLKNGSSASAEATFDVNGKTYGPLAAGKALTVAIALQTGSSVEIKVSSGGQVLVNQSDPADPCPAAAPTATAALSCSAGGIVVTLANATTATEDASFEVNGASYGPIAPGGSLDVTVTVSPGTVGTLSVSSGGTVILSGASYTNSCAAEASALATVACAQSGGEGGTLALQLSDGAAATLPASFTVTATGNTTGGYGPSTVGPVGAGATQTLLIPIDNSGNSINLTVTSGGTSLLSQALNGCSEGDDDG